MSQADEILRDLKAGKKLTPIEALENYGCFRLGARIFDLKRKGHSINTEMVEDQHKGKRYARYSIGETA